MDVAIRLRKAEQCLAGAALAVRHGQYNNAANRAYYAVFQAAIAALSAAGVEPPAPRYWSHDFVLREYCRQAPDDGGRYAGSCRTTLKALQDVRLKADYETEALSRITGERALTLAQDFVDAVRQRIGGEVACPPSPVPRGRRRSSSR
jgi:uncharacterized protein (UPF0332 family)